MTSMTLLNQVRSKQNGMSLNYVIDNGRVWTVDVSSSF